MDGNITIHKHPLQEMGLVVMSEHSIKMASCVFCSDNLQSEACFAAADDDEYIIAVYDANDDDDDEYMSEDAKKMMHLMMIIQKASCVFCSFNLQSRSTVLPSAV